MKVYLAVVIEGGLGIDPAKIRLTRREAETDAELLRRVHQYTTYGGSSSYADVKIIEADASEILNERS